MDFLKYMNCGPYDDDRSNCWHFVQWIYYQEKEYLLPEYPVFATHKDFKGNLIANVKHIEHTLKDCKEGYIVHVSCLGHEHAGYAINDRQYIHKTRKGVQVADIPDKALIYEITG